MRLIDADELLNQIKYKPIPGIITETWNELYERVLDEIDSAPTVEMPKALGTVDKNGDIKLELIRPQGKWQECENTLYTGGGYTKCSNCDMRYSWGSYHEVFEFAYCPTCGAKMEVSNDS